MDSFWHTVLKPTLIVTLVCLVLAFLQAGALLLEQEWLALGMPIIIIVVWIVLAGIIDKIIRTVKPKNPHDPYPWN